MISVSENTIEMKEYSINNLSHRGLIILSTVVEDYLSGGLADSEGTKLMNELLEVINAEIYKGAE